MARNINIGKVALKFCGLWDNITAYNAFDCVNNNNNSSFVALKDVPIDTPLTDEEYWLRQTNFDGVADAEAARVEEFETKIMQIDSDVEAAEQAVIDVGVIGDEKIEAVNTTGTTQVNAINTAGNAKVSEIQSAGAVLYSNQTLNDTQKTTSRGNIGAASDTDLTIHKDSLDSHPWLFRNKTDLIVASKSGDSLITVPDSAGGWIKSLTVYGKSVQDGTPSPDMPVPINGVSGNLGKSGKNLLKKMNTIASHDITYTVADDGVVTINGTAAGTSTHIGESIAQILGAGTYTLSINNLSTELNTSCYVQIYINGTASGRNVKFITVNGKLTFTLASGEIITGYRIRIESGVTFTNFVIKPQLELGSTATPYEPYVGATYASPDLQGIQLGATIPAVISANPQLMAGVYHDGSQYWCGDTWEPTVLVDGVYRKRVTQRVNHLTFDGSADESWNISTSDTPEEGYTQFWRSVLLKSVNPTSARSLCNIAPFVAYNYASAVSGLSQSFESSGYVINLKLPTAIASTVKELRTFLTTTSMELYYLLATPIVTLGDPVFIDTPKGTLNLYHTSAVQPYIEADYPLDIKTYVDNKVTELTAAIAELSAT